MRHRLTPPLSGSGLLAGAFTLLLAIFVTYDASAQVRLVEAGIVCPRPVEGELADAPNTEAGHIRRITDITTFDLLDRTVPALTDLSFGFRIELAPGLPDQAITVVIEHPPLGPRRVTRQEWEDTILRNGRSLNLFTFEFDYEKVPGPWTFSIEIDDAPVVSVAFEVVTDGGSGRVEQTCFQFLS